MHENLYALLFLRRSTVEAVKDSFNADDDCILKGGTNLGLKKIPLLSSVSSTRRGSLQDTPLVVAVFNSNPEPFRDYPTFL